MRENTETGIADLLKEQVRLYLDLLAHQEQRIGLSLKEDFTLLEQSLISDRAVIDQLTALQEVVKQRLAGRTLAQASVEEEGSELKDLCRQLELLSTSLQRVNQRNRKFISDSLAFSRVMLRSMFSDCTSYNQNGFLQEASSGVEF
jgi:hypothetical protein